MDENRWPVGEAEVQNLIDHGEIEEVAPSPEHAELLMGQAETHLASAPTLLPSDPTGAFAVLYDAAPQVARRRTRQAGSAGDQQETQEAIEAQSGPNASKVVRPFRSLRLRRHDAEYSALDTPEVTAAEAGEAWTTPATSWLR